MESSQSDAAPKQNGRKIDPRYKEEELALAKQIKAMEQSVMAGFDKFWEENQSKFEQSRRQVYNRLKQTCKQITNQKLNTQITEHLRLFLLAGIEEKNYNVAVNLSDTPDKYAAVLLRQDEVPTQFTKSNASEEMFLEILEVILEGLNKDSILKLHFTTTTFQKFFTAFKKFTIQKKCILKQFEQIKCHILVEFEPLTEKMITTIAKLLPPGNDLLVENEFEQENLENDEEEESEEEEETELVQKAEKKAVKEKVVKEKIVKEKIVKEKPEKKVAEKPAKKEPAKKPAKKQAKKRDESDDEYTE
ncbi:Cytochrome_c oxidase assembly factor 8 [Hexamita inflata]|uniref:Cytochrome c oxidase assembly factor 8 n=1 Tax=Hexamita inflata TaxID=28002 RepID=A0AA86N3S8_9EUKA|nr:Cytochrome c oxidase assembly factor 8 [Hexamita inflata]